MLKRILATVIAISMLSVPVFAAHSFTDIDSYHWGWGPVSKLVDQGTIKGYEDGSFKPNNNVTRAEFVKMMGEGTNKRGNDFSDVPASHWGYKYIMTSEFDTPDNNFLPNKPILRDEVITLLYKRKGSMKNIIAPSAITEQSKNKDAIAWAYSYGIMLGDDGLNLRLNDPISRVEAAALIVRTNETDFSKSKTNFVDTVKPEVLKTVFESFDLFDEVKPYNPDATMTNGEMSRAALRLAAYEKNLTYSSYVYEKKFDHPYAKDVTIVAERAIGKDFATKEFADKTATADDMVSAFSFAIIQKSANPISFGNTNNYYKDVDKNIDNVKNVFLTFAYENGIELYADGKINYGKPATYKDLAALLLQLDNKFGTQVIFTTKKNESGRYIRKDAKLNLNLAAYPKNNNQYICVFKDVPNAVYEKAIPSAKPRDLKNYNFAREFGELFMSKLDTLILHIEQTYGVKVSLELYPNMVWDTGKGFALRVLCNIEEVKKETSVDSVFTGTLVTPVTGNLKPGMSFFIELQTGYAIFM